MWPLLALGSALAFCFVSVCDKRLLSFHLNGVPPLCLWCGATGLIYGTIVAAIVGIPADTTWQVAATPAVAGLFMGCSVVLLFRGLRLMEASRAVAISQTNPIFVAILALMFLGERISLAQWCGVRCPLAAGLLAMASAVVGRDLRAEGRTLENLGLAGKTRDEVATLLRDGFA